MAQNEVSRQLMAIGYITGAHGIRGEVKVELLTDYPERFKPGADMLIGSETSARSYRITAARPHKLVMLVQFAGVPDRNAAAALQGQLVLIPDEEAMPLGEDENYIHDLIGLRVEDENGAVLGTLSEILTTGANDVYVVAGEEGELLLPALRDVVRQVDLAGRRVIVSVPEGLRDDSADSSEIA
jgi:16S rRNA processing protein RimM